MFNSGKMKQHLYWEEISKKMTEKSHNISVKKCCTKFQTLKRTYYYKQIKDHNKSGNERKTWEDFEVCCHLILYACICNMHIRIYLLKINSNYYI